MLLTLAPQSATLGQILAPESPKPSLPISQRHNTTIARPDNASTHRDLAEAEPTPQVQDMRLVAMLPEVPSVALSAASPRALLDARGACAQADLMLLSDVTSLPVSSLGLPPASGVLEDELYLFPQTIPLPASAEAQPSLPGLPELHVELAFVPSLVRHPVPPTLCPRVLLQLATPALADDGRDAAACWRWARAG